MCLIGGFQPVTVTITGYRYVVGWGTPNCHRHRWQICSQLGDSQLWPSPVTDTWLVAGLPTVTVTGYRYMVGWGTPVTITGYRYVVGWGTPNCHRWRWQICSWMGDSQLSPVTDTWWVRGSNYHRHQLRIHGWLQDSQLSPSPVTDT